jgi:hypothetical protein
MITLVSIEDSAHKMHAKITAGLQSFHAAFFINQTLVGCKLE